MWDKAAPALGPPGTGKTFVTFLAVVIAMIRAQLTFAWLANGNAPLREVAALLEELVPWDAPLAGLARRMLANNEAGREFAKPTGFDAAYSERPALIPRLRLIVATAHICTQEIRGQVGYDERADVVIVDEAQQAVHFRNVLLLSLLRPGGLTWYVGDPTQPLGPAPGPADQYAQKLMGVLFPGLYAKGHSFGGSAAFVQSQARV